jgi:alginate O-acetyltransferase complex protein AlgI
VIVLILIIAGNYLFSLWIKHSKKRLALAIVFNVGILVGFKYLNFLTGTQIVNSVPLGISFITFTAIAYIVDIYRGKTILSYNPYHLTLHISLFPKIISGPLERIPNIEKQWSNRVNLGQFASGIKRFIVGLGKKILIANTVGIVVDQIFSIPIDSLPMATAWLGIICFTVQLFFDFSGYTDMAIGLGKMFGFEFMENFNYPYISQSIREFWNRWHITLSRWLRDYLYIPLGGNRGTILRTCLNLLIVFLVCGIWHGANWTFIIWGLWHGIFLVLERVIKIKVWQPLKHIYALLVIMVGWVFFRSESVGYALGYLKSMFGLNQGNSAYDVTVYISLVASVALLAGVILSLPVSRYLNRLKQRFSTVYSFATIVGLAGIFVLSIIEIASGYYKPFLYGAF